jgi:hypothetical protein
VGVAFGHAQAAVTDFQLDNVPRRPCTLHCRHPTMTERMHRPHRDSNLFADRVETVRP